MACYNYTGYLQSAVTADELRGLFSPHRFYFLTECINKLLNVKNVSNL